MTTDADFSPRIAVLRAGHRAVSAGDGVESRHGLSFGAHYDPDRTAFGALVAHNVDVLAPGAAYGTHEHRDTEILTWVGAGAMLHVGPDGPDGVAAGSLQYLATGTGWRHDERCAGAEETHLVQMWIAPAPDDPPPAPPCREVVTPAAGDVVLAGEGGALALRRSGVRVLLLRPRPGETREPGSGRWRHVHVLDGTVSPPAAVDAPEGSIAAMVEAGDTLEISGAGPCPLDAGPAGATLLVVTTD